MKKLIAVVLLMLCIASLCACGEKVCQEHTFEGPTCTDPKACTNCGEVAAEALNHNWMPANCVESRHCTRCGLVDETAPLHNWKDATCVKPKICARCEITEGEALGHTYVDGACTVCSESMPDMPAAE